MSQNVPLLDLAEQFRRHRDDLESALRPVIESQHFVLGKWVGELECQVAGVTGARHAVGCASGTDALILGLYALGVRPGDDVVVPAFTFFATAGAVVRLGARPVFADIEPDTFCLDREHLEASLTPATRAVVPVHLFGQPAPMGPLLALARERGIAVLEDAAQAIGARLRGDDGTWVGCGALGDGAAFSFYPTKNLGGWGDGGMVTTGSPETDAILRKARVHGGAKMYHHDFVGWNSRLDSLQAAVLLAKLPHLAGWNERRRNLAARYDRLFTEAGLAPGPVTVPVVRDGVEHVFHQYTIRAERRDELKTHLGDHGIGSAIFYPVPLHLQECFAELGGREGQLPESERAVREVLSLPVSPELTESQQDRVVETIATFYRG